MTRHQAFAIWLTGLPASGKSAIVSALRPQLEALGLVVEVLESDAVRRILTPAPPYSKAERDLFYRALAYTGQRLVAHGVTVIFDATANEQAYRDFAREGIPRFVIEKLCYLGGYSEAQRPEHALGDQFIDFMGEIIIAVRFQVT